MHSEALTTTYLKILWDSGVFHSVLGLKVLSTMSLLYCYSECIVYICLHGTWAKIIYSIVKDFKNVSRL